MRALNLNLKKSKYYCNMLFLLGFISLLGIFYATPQLADAVVISLLFILPYYRYCQFAGWRNKGIERLSYADDSWCIRQKGEWHDVNLIHTQSAWPGMLVLIFESEHETDKLLFSTRRKKIVLPIFSDMLADSEYRQLCARARFSRDDLSTIA